MKISKRIEISTLIKILEFSNTNGPQKKTNMATNCKMSYTRFIPILNIMVLLMLLEIKDAPFCEIVITECGKKLLERLRKH